MGLDSTVMIVHSLAPLFLPTLSICMVGLAIPMHERLILIDALTKNFVIFKKKWTTERKNIALVDCTLEI